MAQEGQQRVLAYNLLAVPGHMAMKARTEKSKVFRPVRLECHALKACLLVKSHSFPLEKLIRLWLNERR